jgi:hypothetical protein
LTPIEHRRSLMPPVKGPQRTKTTQTAGIHRNSPLLEIHRHAKKAKVHSKPQLNQKPGLDQMMRRSRQKGWVRPTLKIREKLSMLKNRLRQPKQQIHQKLESGAKKNELVMPPIEKNHRMNLNPVKEQRD